MDLWPHQKYAVSEVLAAIARDERRLCLCTPTGGGKCLGHDTPVLLWNGRVIPVQDVIVGDRLMGPDSLPRIVLSTATGQGELWRVVPVKGDSYVVNDEHILSLRMTNDGTGRSGSTVNISVKKYLAASNTFRHCAKGWRTGVDFPELTTPELDPYFLGLWLGDGTSNLQTITTPEPEVKAYLAQYAQKLGLRLAVYKGRGCEGLNLAGCGKRPNVVLEWLRELDLIDNKHIPWCYRCSDFWTRATVLAGVMDADGSLGHSGYDYSSVRPVLANDVAYLARSLGLAAYVASCRKRCQTGAEGTYYRVSISGDCSWLPLRVPRKQCPERRQKKNVLVTGIRLYPAGHGHYYGFEIDGDGLFMLGDFTVTHNTEDMRQLTMNYLGRGKRVALYTNRRALTEQTSEAFLKAGIYHGVMAADWEDEREHPFQVASIQTVHSRVIKGGQWGLHDAELVLVDEGHLQNNPTARKILQAHWEAGAAYVLFTATPLALADVCQTLIVAGAPSELRACGAIVPAVHYGPDEPDLRAFKKLREGQDPSAKEQRSAMMTPTIFGRIWANYCQLNPGQKPCVVFGPGVDESFWIAKQFIKKGIAAAHLDGDDCWLDGRLRKSDRSAREEIRDRHQAGDIKVVSNRYVLREGINWPWIEHIILAFVAGSLGTFLQVGGRGLRAYPGKTQCIIQDHGGAWHRHGSLNEDRDWKLCYTSETVAGMRIDALRNRRLPHPFRCPQCSRIWTSGRRCHPAHGGCGYELPPQAKFSRPVVSTDGTLRELEGDIYRPRSICRLSHGPKLWERMYHRSKTEKGSRTFRAAAALFAQENFWQYPDPSWPLMPTDPLDWFRLIKDIPREKLTS